MDGRVQTILEKSNVLYAIHLMSKSMVRHLPVVDNKDHLTALVGQTDITRGMELKYNFFLRKSPAEEKKNCGRATTCLKKR